MLALALVLAATTQLDRCLNEGEAARGVTPAMSACYVADYQRADAQLNATYSAAMKRIPVARRAVLRASQRAWIRKRDAACPIDDRSGVGTIETLNHPACLTKQTTRRTSWLTRFR
ncbi:uncharacterized protein YecT (DUF1311 family) [Sphingomonas jinjuensis]|uniref:Uncharacterized protein YecT (DUF1311 family) n=1 Tax=Sphingomonas jinjuensis TaxID=535907 RepID=A0A840FHC5_9SPHN|nr:lysozyme inhibitor LprI family protein [Sphingomonas jinjuensis]MBB4155566.1 uncharacterized protein YecT (DUF1311 family) [Sphingomonas jinjuensis]